MAPENEYCLSNASKGYISQLFKAKNKSWIGQYYNPDVRLYDKSGLIAFLVNGNTPLVVFGSVTFDTFTNEDLIIL